MGAIDKVRETLEGLETGKYKFPDITMSGGYSNLVNLKTDGFQIGVDDGFGDKLAMKFEPDIVISPVFIGPPRRNKKSGRIKDWLSIRLFASVFIDLKNKRLDIGTSETSGGRGRYDMFATWCQRRKVPTFVPLYAGDRLLKLYYFHRFVGRVSFHGQWNRRIGEFGLKGYENVTHLSTGFIDDSVVVNLFPEGKKITLLEFRKEVVV